MPRPPDIDPLVWKALCALDAVVRRSSRGPVDDDLAIRFVLAWLFSVGDRQDRACFDNFWRHITNPRSTDFSQRGANYERQLHAGIELVRIARTVGVDLNTPAGLELYMMRRPEFT